MKATTDQAHKEDAISSGPKSGPSSSGMNSMTDSKDLVKYKIPPAVMHPKKQNKSERSFSVQMKLVDSFSSNVQATSAATPIIIEDEGQKGLNSLKEDQVIRRKKRKSLDISVHSNPLAKMLKQSEKFSATCPMCGLQFKDLSNVAINQHIDSCLSGTITH